jgi:hypothetical protein
MADYEKILTETPEWTYLVTKEDRGGSWFLKKLGWEDGVILAELAPELDIDTVFDVFELIKQRQEYARVLAEEEAEGYPGDDDSEPYEL